VINQNKQSFILFFCIVAGLVLALFFSTRTHDVLEHTQRLDSFLQLRELDALLDEEVLLIASGLRTHYDQLVAYRRSSDELLANMLDERNSFISGLDDTSIMLLKSYQSMQAHKEDVVEEIKHSAALIRNGLLYMPQQVQALRQDNHPYRDDAARILSALYRYHLYPMTESRDELEQQLYNLVRQNTGDELLSLFISQASTSLRHLSNLHDYRDEYVAVDTRIILRQLEVSYQQVYLNRLKVSEYLTLFLLVLSAVLLFVMTLLFRRLQHETQASKQATNRLQDAVNSLSEAFALFDSKGSLVLFNQKWLEYYPWLNYDSLVDWPTIASKHAEVGIKSLSAQTASPRVNQYYIEHLPNNRCYQASNNMTQDGGWVCVRTDISVIQQTEFKLRMLGRALEQSPVAVMITDKKGVIEYVNLQLAEMTGYSESELLGKNNNILKSGEMPRQIFEDMWRELNRGNMWSGHLLNKKKDGCFFWESTSISPLRTEGGDISHFIAIKEDITERLVLEEQLKMVAVVFETTNEAIMIADQNGRIKTVNPAFTKITGFTKEEVIGKNPSILSSGRHDRNFYNQMWNTLSADGAWAGEIWNRRKDGSVYPEWLSISVIRNDSDEISEYVSVFSDITSRKNAEARIRHQAYYDALTELPNRTLLMDRLEMSIVSANRDQQTLALLFVDLDRFKYVNDTLGHEYGDELLVNVARRLLSCVRESDTVARFGGDEFVVLLHNICSGKEAGRIAEKMIQQLSYPFMLAGREIIIGASIGIAMYPSASGSADNLLRNADLAMYSAKQAGRNRYQFFSEQLQEDANSMMEMEQDLRVSLEQKQLEVYYQPIIDSRTLRLVGVEALLRWNHPIHGMISPDRFIPLAEDTGMIGVIGQWVLETACQQAGQWITKGYNLYLSVNLSGRQRSLGLDEVVLRRILESTAFKPENLVLEITEGMLLDNSHSTIEWLTSFSRMGVQLAIDDFGTGYSALSYLKRFPIDILKIDREFIRELGHNTQDMLVVKAIISMAKSLKLRIIAEGVETDEQLTILKGLNCEFVQGYLFSKPVTAHELEASFDTLRKGVAKPLV